MIGRPNGNFLRAAAVGGLVACLAAGLTACSSGGSASSGGDSSVAQDGSPYKVSVAADLSGAGGANGIAGVAGFQAAIKTVNDAGGVNGKKIAVSDPVDALSTTDGAQGAVRQVLSQDPIAILHNTLNATAIVPIAQPAAVTTLSIVSLQSMSVPPQKWFYSASLTKEQAGKAWVSAAADSLNGSLKGKKISLVYYGSASITEYAGEWTKGIVAGGGSVVTEDPTAATIASFTTQAAKIVSAKADLVFIYDLAGSTTLELNALVSAGYKGAILAGDTVSDDASIAKLSAITPQFSAERIYSNSVAGDAMSVAATKYGYSQYVASSYFVKGFVLGYALVAGLKKCGAGCTVKTLPAAMQSAGVVDAGPGIAFGPLQFTSTSHVLATKMQYFKMDPATKKIVTAGAAVSLN
jgi:branched-chain amino acid transport system substrate-binding protein